MPLRLQSRCSTTPHTWTTFAHSSVTADPDLHFKRFIVVIATDEQLGNRICRKVKEAEPNLHELEPVPDRLLEVSSAFAEELSRTMHAGAATPWSNTQEPMIPAAANSGTRGNLMLSKRLRTLRLKENISLFELAKRSGVQLQVLVDCEKEGQEPDRKVFPHLAMALGVELNDLFSA